MTVLPFGWKATRCLTCDCVIPMPESTYNDFLQSHANFHCYWGHSQHFTKEQGVQGRLAELQRERDRLAQRIAEKDDTIRAERERTESARRIADHNQRSDNAYKGVATKLKKRAVAGVCPCCNRQFRELERHMASKHPNFASTPIVRKQDEVLQ